MVRTPLLLGIDGGGTACRARLVDLEGHIRGEGTAGPANIRFGIKESFAAVLRATDEALAQAGLSLDDADIVACLALAGATEPTHLAAARAYELPFRRVVVHHGRACRVRRRPRRQGWRDHHRRDGKRRLGCRSAGESIASAAGAFRCPTKEAAPGSAARWRAACCGRYDGRCAWTGLLKKVLERFDGDPHAIVRWMGAARPRDFAALAPLVLEYAAAR